MAFDVWDFVSGDNKTAIEHTASARGDTLQHFGDLTVINRYHPDTKTYETFHLEFCNGRLSEVTEVAPFTPVSFVNALSDLIRQHGTPAISASERTMHSPADIALREVKYTWGSLNDRIQLTTNISTASTVNLEPGMLVTHTDATICGLTSQSP
jgi:hypothetical protein